MTNEITQAIANNLSPQVVVWFWKVTAWMGIARLVMKPVSGLLLGVMTRIVAIKPKFALSLVNSNFYQVVAFLCDYSSSVKLPTKDSIILNDVKSI